MRRGAFVLFLVVATLLAGFVPLLGFGTVAASVVPAASPKPLNITGNLSGPSLVATSSNGTFYLNASNKSGTPSLSINWTASLSSVNSTGSSVKPVNGTITASTVLPIKLVVTTGTIAESMTLTVKLSPEASTSNQSMNLSKTFSLVTPYMLRATLVAGPDSGVLPFNVTVALDGTVVGAVTVPKLAANATYDLVYRYPSAGLPSGYHTFTLSLQDEHGLVTFANGATVQSTTFYVAPAAPNNTVWYVAGVVAFFGALFIYATRVGARRRGPARR